MKRGSSLFHDKHRYALIIIVVFSILISLAILTRRNIYDDEIASYQYISLPLKELWSSINSDAVVHPPAMFLFSRFSYLLTGSVRYSTLLPLSFWYIGLVLFAASAAKLLTTVRAKILFYFLCGFHPHILMWINSLRWYPYWSGIALAIIAVGLCYVFTRPDSNNSTCMPNFRISILLGVLAGFLFYFNYLTIFFGFWFAVSFLILYGFRRDTFKRLAAIYLTAIFVILPQIGPFFNVHLKNAESWLGQSFISVGRIIHGLSVGEAIMPWHPITPFVILVVLLPPLAYAGLNIITNIKNYNDNFSSRRLISLSVFLIGMFITVALTKIGYGGARYFIFLNPILALFISYGAEKIKKRWWWILATAITVLWVFAGTYNLLTKQGTAKGGINDPIEKIKSRIIEITCKKPAVIFLHDPSLAYFLNEASAREGLPWTTCSVYHDYIHNIKPGLSQEVDNVEYIVVIESYIGSLRSRENMIRRAIKNAKDSIIDPESINMGYDPDAAWKTIISGESLPRYRYTITYGKLKEGTKLKEIGDNFCFLLQHKRTRQSLHQRLLSRP